MHACRVATAAPVVGTAHVADQRTNVDRLTQCNGRPLQHMAVDRDEAAAMIELDAVAETTTPAGLDHLSGARSIDSGSSGVGDIQTVVEAAIASRTPAER